MQPVTPEERSSPPPTQGVAAEMGLMLRRGREVWRLVPRKHKWALAGAAVVMACTSVCSTALALFMGNLVDGVKPDKLESQTNGSGQYQRKGGATRPGNDQRGPHHHSGGAPTLHPARRGPHSGFRQWPNRGSRQFRPFGHGGRRVHRVVHVGGKRLLTSHQSRAGSSCP